MLFSFSIVLINVIKKIIRKSATKYMYTCYTGPHAHIHWVVECTLTRYSYSYLSLLLLFAV